jgi:hypothetical protein
MAVIRAEGQEVRVEAEVIERLEVFGMARIHIQRSATLVPDRVRLKADTTTRSA